MDVAGERRQYDEMDYYIPRRSDGEKNEGPRFNEGVKDPQHQGIVCKGNWRAACIAC
jgi:hypothetical protein